MNIKEKLTVGNLFMLFAFGTFLIASYVSGWALLPLGLMFVALAFLVG